MIKGATKITINKKGEGELAIPETILYTLLGKSQTKIKLII